MAESDGFRRMKERLSHYETEEGRCKGLDFKPRSDDVFVVTSPKCGTTWMQQILHQLRSGGDMSFENIGVVIPYIEMAYDCEIKLEDEQQYHPRCFKTHTWYPDCPKGAGKYIVIYREPCAAFFSFFKFFRGWFFEPGEVSLPEFITAFLLARGVPKDRTQDPSYFVHLVSWWEHRHDSNVLFLFYEDMKDDLENVVRKVAAFIGIGDEERIKKTVEMSSFEFMKKYMSTKFSELSARYRNTVCGVAHDATPVLVDSGSTTKGRDALDEATKKAIQSKWREVVTRQIGFDDYEELRNAYKRELKNKINDQ